ncbi:fungal-specific transcription factor domain-containing protein [Hypoxylon crocopeplum]|nr:fungal-specific transcription factor domain-containing protein [Hypoxylon crocopeplum]
MASRDQKRRSALSCDSCRRRKSKCNRLHTGSCERCTAAGKECTTSNVKGSRPYYQTSKEQFELMSNVVSHFFPRVSLEVEDLRNIVSTLELQKSNPSSSHSAPLLGHARSPCESGAAVETRDSHQLSDCSTSQDFISGELGGLAEAPCPPINPSLPQQDHELLVHASNSTSDQIEQVYLTPETVSSPKLVGSNDKLITDATNTPRLDNGSGWASFFRKVHSDHLFTSRSVAPPCSLSEYTDGRPIAMIVPTDLPLRSQVDEAAVTFFSEVNNIVYILNFEQFEDTVEHIYDGQQSSNAGVASMLAVVALAEGSDDAFDRAYHYLDQTVAEGSLESVQAIMLYSICRLNRGERNAGWILLGCALRIARSLGLHRGSTSLSRERRHVKEMKVRLWWSLYSLDTHLTCSIGRPLDGRNVAYKEITEWLEKDDLCVNPYTPPGYAAVSASLNVILENILSRLYSNTSQPGNDRSVLVTELLSLLDSWLEELPLYLRPDCRTAPTHLRAVSHLSLRYYEHVILVTRPYLLKSDDRSHEFAVRCEDANRRSIAILKELHRGSLLSRINYFDGMHVLSNGMILLRALRCPTPDILAELENYHPILQATRQLKIGRLASDNLVSYIDNLRVILHSQYSSNPEPGEVDIGREGTDRITPNQTFEDLWDSAFTPSVGVDWSVFPM